MGRPKKGEEKYTPIMLEALEAWVIRRYAAPGYGGGRRPESMQKMHKENIGQEFRLETTRYHVRKIRRRLEIERPDLHLIPLASAYGVYGRDRKARRLLAIQKSREEQERMGLGVDRLLPDIEEALRGWNRKIEAQNGFGFFAVPGRSGKHIREIWQRLWHEKVPLDYDGVCRLGQMSRFMQRITPIFERIIQENLAKHSDMAPKIVVNEGLYKRETKPARKGPPSIPARASRAAKEYYVLSGHAPKFSFMEVDKATYQATPEQNRRGRIDGWPDSIDAPAGKGCLCRHCHSKAKKAADEVPAVQVVITDDGKIPVCDACIRDFPVDMRGELLGWEE